MDLGKFTGSDDPNSAASLHGRNKFFLFGALFIIALVAYHFLTKDKVDGKVVKKPEFTIVEEEEMAKTKWVGKASMELQKSNKKMEAMTEENKRLSKDMQNMKSLIKKMQKREENPMDKNLKDLIQNQKNGDIKPDNGSAGNFYNSFPNPFSQKATPVDPNPRTVIRRKNESIGEAGQLPDQGHARVGDVPQIKQEERVRVRRMGSSLGFDSPQKRKPKKIVKKKVRKRKDIILAGSISRAILLSGVDAPTMAAAKTNPLPVLMKVVDFSILPNRWRYDINECFMMGEGYGDLTAERAYFRINTLSCITNEGKHISVPFKGVVNGEDGKAGLRGDVVTKQGAMLARSLAAGFLEGIGQAFGQQGQTTYTSAAGTASTTSASNSDTLKAGLFQGMSKSVEKLAEFYLKMADQISPVIEISAGRMVDIIATAPIEIVTMEDQELLEQAKNVKNEVEN